MFEFPGQKPGLDAESALKILAEVETRAEQDAATLRARSDPYARARALVTLKVRDEAREAQSRLRHELQRPGGPERLTIDELTLAAYDLEVMVPKRREPRLHSIRDDAV